MGWKAAQQGSRREREEGAAFHFFKVTNQKRNDILLFKFLMAGAVVMAIFISYITMQEGAKEERIRQLLGNEDPEANQTP